MYYGIIYSATNSLTGKTYIGQTIEGLDERRRKHLKDARSNKKWYHPFYRDIYMFGKEIFIWDIIDYAESLSELNKKECYYIRVYDTFENGYNRTLGGVDGYPLAKKSAEEIKNIHEKIRNSVKDYFANESSEKKKDRTQKVSASLKESWASKSQEERKAHGLKTGAKLKGITFSEEHCLALSKAKKGKRLNDNIFLQRVKSSAYPDFDKESFERCQGESKSKEIRQPLKSESKKGEKNPMYGVYGADNPRSKTIRCTDLRTGEQQIIVGIQEAARILGIPATYICRTLKHHRRSCYGYAFEYVVIDSKI